MVIIMAGGKRGIGIHELEGSPWIKIGKVSDIEKIKLLHELDQGEAEVIILAKEKEINQVLIDERVARIQAKALGLNVIGTHRKNPSILYTQILYLAEGLRLPPPV
jgi:hypothetical protein